MAEIVREALARATAILSVVSDTARLDAELLMAHALGIDRGVMLLGWQDMVAPSAKFDPLVTRRRAHEPVAYIVGTRDFWTISLDVGPGVLIPRPDSETLIEAAVAHFGRPGPKRVLDLGTGSGALLLAALAEWPRATGLGIDRSPAAVHVALGNAGRLGLLGRAEIREGDWADGIDERFDLVLCNPPYIDGRTELPPDVADFEPSSALFAGPGGLDDYRLIAPQIARLITPGGLAVIEIGADQGESVGALFKVEGLETTLARDLGGRDRAIIVKG